jgi:hypothetical protein
VACSFLSLIACASASFFGIIPFSRNYLNYRVRSGCLNLDPKTFLFWYRQSQRPLLPNIRSDSGLVMSKIAPDNPPLQFSGDVLVTLDIEGRLVSFHAVPSKAQSSAGTWPIPKWEIFFTEAGIDISHWAPSNAQQPPCLTLT